jgi:uncharacterized protein with GYD domain
MATFISLITFTDKGIQHVSETTERVEVFNEFTNRVNDHFKNVVYWAVERHDADVVVKDIYWTHGLYDGIVILEAPDAEIAMSVFLHLDSQGNVRTHSFQAFSKEEMRMILAKSD